LYVEEVQNNPYASFDLNSSEVLNNPKLKEQVEQAKKHVDEVVKKRFEYIKLNFIDKNKPIVDTKAYQNNQ
jgi:CRISPR/Cas system CMR-associated protein Cmr1 (group 7 of RAMP superfamily)